ncbi:AAA family ATPase [Candidatus Dependentiae bacterium]|nr:AAA family ATPase [Candidatus Dependentiae bacterium]
MIPSAATALFITGERNVGKSTLIKRICASLNVNTKGFQTFSEIENSTGKRTFYIKSFNSPEKKIIGQKNPDNNLEIFPDTFDSFGTEILNLINLNDNNLIIFDEIGRFEETSLKFKNKIKDLIADKHYILGVLKKWDSPFLKMIPKMKGVFVLEINKENREEKYFEILKFIKNNWLNLFIEDK